MPRQTVPTYTLADYAKFPIRKVKNPRTGIVEQRKINPHTGKFARRPKALMTEFREVIKQVVAQEAPLTLRRLHYVLVEMGLQNNNRNSYTFLTRIVLQMRRPSTDEDENVLPPEIPAKTASGQRTFVDNIRETLRREAYESLDHGLHVLSQSYHRDPWIGLKHRVLILVEKDALRGVLWPVCAERFVPLGIARGRASESWLEVLAEEIAEEGDEYGGELHIGYVGDYDPTGVFNGEDIEKRLRALLSVDGVESGLVIDRIGLNGIGMVARGLTDQVAALGLPESMEPKEADPMYKRWVAEGYGDFVYEADAVAVATMQRWVADYIDQFISAKDFARAEEDTKDDLARLDEMSA